MFPMFYSIYCFGPKIVINFGLVEFFDTNLKRWIKWDGPEVLISLQKSKLILWV